MTSGVIELSRVATCLAVAEKTCNFRENLPAARQKSQNWPTVRVLYCLQGWKQVFQNCIGHVVVKNFKTLLFSSLFNARNVDILLQIISLAWMGRPTTIMHCQLYVYSQRSDFLSPDVSTVLRLPILLQSGHRCENLKIFRIFREAKKFSQLDAFQLRHNLTFRNYMKCLVKYMKRQLVPLLV